ncbi:MAG: efflux RND transporter periplasmic adaptor subunit [Alphaproteobacteria bacterium]|nr:efflux RND transporter periplasmic adaptor subunit [Alphaproteobacteria bacterium]
MYFLNKTLLPILCVAIALSACKDETSKSNNVKPVSVTVLEVKNQDIPLEFEYTARAQGSKETEVRARVDGILLKRHYIEGSEVKEGDLLFEIDPEPYKIALQQAQAELSQIEANLEAAQNNWDRISELYKTKVVSEKSRDEAKSNLGSLQASKQLVQAKVDAAKLNLAYTKVTAPIDGITGMEAYSEGSLINKNSLLTHITQVDPMYVIFPMSENELMSMSKLVQSGKIKNPKDDNAASIIAKLYLGDGNAYPYSGKLNFMTPNIDTSTGTVKIRAVFDNPNKTLRTGQFLRLVIEGLTRKNAIKIPQSAVLQNAKGTYVYKVNSENMIETVAVHTGLATKDNHWIIDEGLSQGDKIVIKGIAKVRPSMEVTPILAD